MTDLLVEHFGDYVDLAFTARMEEELDEIARGERAWVPLLQAFYAPLRDRVAEKRKELRRSDFTTEETDEVCSLGHPMVIRLGRNGRFLACSMYPEHKETRPLPGEEPPPQEGTGEVCPKCGEGTLVGRRGRFGPFLGCSRYPECDYIKREGPPPPDPLPFEVTCPKNNDGHLVPRRARRTGNVFWGCSNYPKCDYTTNNEPLGGLHDTDDGPLARKGEAAICLTCGSTSEAAPDGIVPGERYPGGPADPEALARPARGGAALGPGPGTWRAAHRRPRLVPHETLRPSRPRRRERGRRAPGAGPNPDPALERFLRSLAARDASPHTIRAYDDRRRARTSTGWPSGAWTGADPTRPDLRAYLARLGGAAHPARPSRSAWRRSAPSTAGRRARARCRRPVGRHRDAAPAASPAPRPGGRPGRPAAGRRSRPSSRPPRPPDRTASPSRRHSPCATAPWSRPPTPRACASASSPRPTSARSTCAVARSG